MVSVKRSLVGRFVRESRNEVVCVLNNHPQRFKRFRVQTTSPRVSVYLGFLPVHCSVLSRRYRITFTNRVKNARNGMYASSRTHHNRGIDLYVLLLYVLLLYFARFAHAVIVHVWLCVCVFSCACVHVFVFMCVWVCMCTRDLPFRMKNVSCCWRR